MILRCDLAYCILSGLARLSRRRNGLTSFCSAEESDDENHFAVEHGRCSAASSMDSRAFREIVFLNLLRASIPPSRRNYPKNGKISYFVELTRFESLTRLPGCRRAFLGFRHKLASNLTKNASHETNHLASRDLPSLPIHCS